MEKGKKVFQVEKKKRLNKGLKCREVRGEKASDAT